MNIFLFQTIDSVEYKEIMNRTLDGIYLVEFFGQLYVV